MHQAGADWNRYAAEIARALITSHDQYRARPGNQPAYSQGWDNAHYQLRCEDRLEAAQQAYRHADVAFTMKQYVQTDLAADRRVATTLAELIIGGSLASTEVTDQARRHEAEPR